LLLSLAFVAGGKSHAGDEDAQTRMSLLPVDKLVADFICPHCRAPLKSADDNYCCTNSDCGRRYSVIDSQPILVNFDESILIEDQLKVTGAASAIRRGSSDGFKRRVVQALLPANRVAASNAARLIDLTRAQATRPKVLIIGGGSKGEGTEALYSDPALRLISFDIYGSSLTQFVADAHQIPLADGSVDAVWIQAVLEHVLDPKRVAHEIHRVLKPGGIVYAETPFLQQVHEGAYDFTRFTESGHRWLFRQFDAIDSGVVLGAAVQLLWSIEHVARGVFRSVAAGVIAKMMFFWLRYLDRLIPRGYASDAASAVYFLGRKSNSAISPKDMVAYYKGAHARRQ
jgi:SAM-dependent methyltransferase